ncbi:MAG: peptidoglycan DD-metalloendopeptidase family protein [Chloroflexi bacterium]|nr:peptidoglycan DD-metalloendopeptidase family protein [Chloroflexota bacterium]
MPFAKAGVQVGDGPATAADLMAIELAGLDAVKLRAGVNPPTDIVAYRDVGIGTFLVQLFGVEAAVGVVTPQDFVEGFAPLLDAFVKKGVRDFEIHSRPNLRECGLGTAWSSPSAFGDWFATVVSRLRTLYGPQIRAGFPALATSPGRLPNTSPVVTPQAFLAACSTALSEADFVCCHVYWRTAAEMTAYDGGTAFLHEYLEAYPTLPLVISEFANVDMNVSAVTKGDQYATFFQTCAQYDACRYDWPWHKVYWPRLQAAYAYVMRSPDPSDGGYTWLDGDGQPGPITSRVGGRRRMPPPAAMRFAWPTEFRNYTQFYGENHRSYYNTSYANSLRGGHNGVDLHVNYQEPTKSPIRACLSGVVTRKLMIETGYGHHVYIESRVNGVGLVTLLYAHMSTVDVEEGQTVQTGDIIGMAGLTGATTGPHLHLSLKIQGFRVPANADYLNPRPYLDPLPRKRGGPRVPYSRTYVLLPPQAGREWATAIIDATWDTNRFTVGGSADDAGIGDLDVRRVIAVTPSAWGGDLKSFFDTFYPGIIYVPVEVETADELAAVLRQQPSPPEIPSRRPSGERGCPRIPYQRSYVLLPPSADVAWARAAIDAAWDKRRFTIGGSADDAGIGDLDHRRVIAVNPVDWGGDLARFFDTYYSGVTCVPLVAETPGALLKRLAEL